MILLIQMVRSRENLSLNSIHSFQTHTFIITEDSDYCFIITNLSTHTDRDKLWEVFGAFGTVKQIEINTEVWAAAVIYA